MGVADMLAKRFISFYKCFSDLQNGQIVMKSFIYIPSRPRVRFEFCAGASFQVADWLSLDQRCSAAAEGAHFARRQSSARNICAWSDWLFKMDSFWFLTICGLNLLSEAASFISKGDYCITFYRIICQLFSECLFTYNLYVRLSNAMNIPFLR